MKLWKFEHMGFTLPSVHLSDLPEMPAWLLRGPLLGMRCALHEVVSNWDF